MLSSLGHRYALIFVDDYSRYTWVYLIKNKSDVYYVFLQFEQFIHRQFNHKILAFHSDWGGEYQKLNTYFKQVSIVHRLACPHTHEQNGVVKRKIRHLVYTSLALLAHANLPLRYWNYAFEMSCSSINNFPTLILNNSSPYFVLFHKYPDYSTQKPFGCTIFPLLRPYNNHKFAFRSTPYSILVQVPLTRVIVVLIYQMIGFILLGMLFLILAAFCIVLILQHLKLQRTFQISRGFTLKVYHHHPRVLLEIQVRPLLPLIFIYFLPLINLQIIPYCQLSPHL